MSLHTADAKLLALDPLKLPQGVRELLLEQPLLSPRVVPDGRAFAVDPAEALPAQAPQYLFCKLGIKSWRDSGSLCLIPAGMPLRAALQGLLAQPTAAQLTVAGAWRRAGVPLALHVFAYRSFADISEARWLLAPHEVRFISACLRGASANVALRALPAMRAIAWQLAAALPGRAHIAELACLPDGTIKLVEINPGLCPNELSALRAA